MASDMKSASQRGGGDGEANVRPSKLQTSVSEKQAAKLEINAGFLRAARAGHLDKVLECLDNDGADINACNPNGLNGLHLASKEGHVTIVCELLQRGAYVDSATKKGNTSLHIASLAGHDEIVRILALNGAKVNVQSQTGFTPLYMAAQENHVDVVKYLLEHGANQNLATEDGFTPLSVALQQGHNRVVAVLMENDTRNKVRLPALHVAAKKDDVRAATLLLNNEQNTSAGGSKVNDATKSGFTPLHIAAHYGSINVARLLLESRADFNFEARNKITPLHVSSKWGRVNIVQLLVDSGANMECVTRDRLTPLHCAARSGHDPVVDVLVEKGALVTSKTKNGLTPLHMAAQGDHTECARILLFHKAPINEVTMDYLTPLHVAAHCGNVKMAKLLLDNKCEVNASALNGFTPLHVACKKNRIKVIELLLRYGASIESTTESGLTPLHVASFMGHTMIVTFLLENGAKTETASKRGETALHLAARANQTEIMRILLRAGANVDAKAKEQQTPLHISSRLGSTEAVLLLLNNGANRDVATKDNYTPLHIAVKEGHEDVVEILLDNGAKHDLTTKKGFTPLHIAAKYGNVPITNILLQKGANPNVEGKNGLTPLHVATHYNNIEVAQLLLSKKGNPLATAKNGYTPLHIAAKRNQVEIAKVLLDHKAKPDSESKNGYTPLHLAAQEGHTEVAELLLSRGATVNCKSKNDLTPMHLAAQEDQVPIAEILVRYKAEIDPRTKAGYTPLHTACHFGQLNMIRFLLEHGASVHATTKLGYTPLHQAAQQGHVLVINILLKYQASPDTLTSTGQSPLSIAQQLGYISVVEILKHVTTVEVETPAVTDKYKVVIPEMMQEAPIDSDDEAGDDTLPADKSYNFSVDDSRDMHYSSDPHKGDQDLFGFETVSGRHSTISSVAGRDPFHEELRYMRDERDDPDHYGGATTPSVGGGTMHDEFKDDMDDESRHRAETPVEFERAEQAYRTESANNRWNGSSTAPSDDTIPVMASPSGDEELKYIWPDDGLPVTPAFVKNQLKYAKPVDQSTLPRRAQSEETSIDELITPARQTDQLALSPQSTSASEFDPRVFGSLYSDASIASSFNPDNITIERNPVILGFLVSFVVDARGGAMRGCRHSGLRVIVPPGRACAPIRITCKFVKRDKLSNPPPLNDCESLATRILKLGPAGALFSGPVMLEVPHFASLRGREREVVVLRSDNGYSWYEHPIVTTDEAVQKCLSGNFEGEELENAEDLYQRRVTRIITTDFPIYFALVTRVRQETKTIGLDGGIISSTVVPQVQAMFPEGAITKGIRVGLQAQPVNEDLITAVLGDNVSVSPIVTIEPRHRKFHQAISITIPLPAKSSLKGGKSKIMSGTPSLRLLCSITGGTRPAQWEDITGANPLKLIGDCVSFETNISARFWLMDCSTVKDAVPNAIDLYREATIVPFMSKFTLFAKRRNFTEARLRVFCVTDDRMEKTLENQEHFVEVARSRDVEVLEGRRQYVEIAGNMAPVTKANEVLYVNFRPFRENRLPLVVRLRELKSEPAGQVLFIPEPPRGPAAGDIQKPPAPICVLNVVWPNVSDCPDAQTPDTEFKEIPFTEIFQQSVSAGVGPADQISRAELKLTDIADALQSDWVPLARQLGLTQQEIISIQRDYTYVSEQALVVLHLWVEKNREQATGNELERALKRIDREDIINRCMHNLEEVTDEREKIQAMACLGSELQPEVKEEVEPKLEKDDHSTLLQDSFQPAYLETNLDDDLPVGYAVPSHCESALKGDESPEANKALKNMPDILDDTFEPKTQQLSQTQGVAHEVLQRDNSLFSPCDLEAELQLAPVKQEPQLVSPYVLSSPKTEPLEASVVDSPIGNDQPLDNSVLELVSIQEPLESKREFEQAKHAATFPDITKQLVKGEPYETMSTEDSEQLADDNSGSVVRRRITTCHRLLPITEVTLADGIEVSTATSDIILSIRIEEVTDILPEGIDDPYASGLETESTVEETTEELPTGGILERRVITTVARYASESPTNIQSGHVVPADQSNSRKSVVSEDGPPGRDELLNYSTENYQPVDGSHSHDEPAVAAIPTPRPVDEPITSVPSSDDQSLTSTVPADELPADEDQIDFKSQSVNLPEASVPKTGASNETGDDGPQSSLRVYTDRTESAPQVDTNVQETEEVLPDGTIVRHRVTTTQQRQLISTRVVVEGPEDALPTSQEEAERLFNKMGATVSIAALDSNTSAPESKVSTNVEEFAETLPDGTVVKRRVVTTLRQQTTAEKHFLGDSDDNHSDNFTSSSVNENTNQ